ncbi:WbqC family protein [Pseudomonas sp. 21LCFQ02]|uniref:WbqC family protein n=1 Tax=unclassified Pseudomonas TaxID=196821 RepID=UPI0004F83FE9|nr:MULTISPECIES: WbqC family protein [unclassified Pseudomonas]MCO8169492.1 WbqC family protein [Pseudomonas sp. 21LCFQ02]MCQ9427388.1 WbqC family protein [Pseudomonas sp. LJDD11]BAP46156.1 putative uncharacterized protein [Pseudomonas sp. StFLB209]
MTRTIAMMQPYLFPYLGYFQLIATADVFVLGDDLQYIRAGWVNRNRILCEGQPRLMTFAVKKDRFELPIMQRQLADSFFENDAPRLVNLLVHSYRKAPYFSEVMPLLERLIRFPQHNLALYAENALREICAYLQISTPILRGSNLTLSACTDKQERVINIAHTFSAGTFLNPIGGLELYDRERFARNGLQLRFFTMNPISYAQLKHEFVPNLSIIDVLMFNSVEQVQALLGNFSVSEGGAANDPCMDADIVPFSSQLAGE